MHLGLSIILDTFSLQGTKGQNYIELPETSWFNVITTDLTHVFPFGSIL